MPPRWRSGAKPRRTIDLCPACHCDLGGATGGTRRIALSARERGRFIWECPDCGGRWEQDAGKATTVVLREARRPQAPPPGTAPGPPPTPVPPRRPVD